MNLFRLLDCPLVLNSQGLDLLTMSSHKLSKPFLVLLCLVIFSLLMFEMLARQFLSQLSNLFGVQLLQKLHFLLLQLLEVTLSSFSELVSLLLMPLCCLLELGLPFGVLLKQFTLQRTQLFPQLSSDLFMFQSGEQLELCEVLIDSLGFKFFVCQPSLELLQLERVYCIEESHEGSAILILVSGQMRGNGNVVTLEKVPQFENGTDSFGSLLGMVGLGG